MNKYYIRIAVLFSAVLVSPFSLFSQQSSETVTLSEEGAVERALENNYAVLMAEQDLKLRELLQDSAWSALYPSIVLRAGLSYVPETTMQSPYHLGINGSLSFGWNFSAATVPSILRAGIDSERSALASEDTRRQVERDVRKLFLDALFQRDSLRLSEAQLAVAVDRYEQTRISYQNGTVDEFTFVSTQLEVENIKHGIKSQEDIFGKLLDTLKLLLGIDLGATLLLDGELNVDQYNNAVVGRTALDSYQRLDVQQLLKSIEQSRLDKKIKQLSLGPTLSLGYSFNPIFSRDPSADSWVNSDYWTNTQGMFTLTLSQSLDVFIPRSRQLSDIQSADLNISTLQMQLDNTVTNAGSRVANLKNDIETARESLRTLELSLSIAERKLELVEDAFNAGTRTFDDLRGVELEYRAAEQNLLREKLQVLKYVIDLAYELHIPFDELKGNS